MFSVWVWTVTAPAGSVIAKLTAGPVVGALVGTGVLVGTGGLVGGWRVLVGTGVSVGQGGSGVAVGVLVGTTSARVTGSGVGVGGVAQQAVSRTDQIRANVRSRAMAAFFPLLWPSGRGTGGPHCRTPGLT